MKRLQRHLILLLFAVVTMASAFAQGVNINVTPVRNILPPQVMYYLSNPGQYFNISVQNTDNEAKLIYFGVELRQIVPSSGIEIIVPGKTMPQRPFEIPAMGTKVLNAAEMRTMFNHVRMEDVSMPSGLFDNVVSGSFGNLPEGTYEIVIFAYKWDPYLSSPVLLSNPALSRTIFTVCYQAKAPEWIMPVSTGEFGDHNIATLSKQTPMLTWMAPVVNCDPKPRNYTYDIKIVQQMPLQAIDEAMERNPVVYQTSGLQMPQCLIPLNVIRNFSPYETYLAQITARSNATQAGSLDYINIINEGKSDIRMFRVKDYSETPVQPATYSRPKLMRPNLPTGLWYAQFDPAKDEVIWSAPQLDNAGGKHISFTYDVRIVKPTSGYYIYQQSECLKAANELEPLFEQKGIRTTSYRIPASTAENLDPKSVYLMQVVAHPDTVAGDYRNLTFEGECKGIPVAFARAQTVLSRPVLVTPSPYQSFDQFAYEDEDISQGVHILLRDNPVIKWMPCEVSSVDEGNAVPNVIYDIKITQPNKKYAASAAGMEEALDNENPFYEKKGLTSTEFRVPSDLFDIVDPKQLFLVQVTARVENAASGDQSYIFLNKGKSYPGLIVLRKTTDITQYSAPHLTVPKPYTEIGNKKFEVLDPNNCIIKWSAPVASGKAQDPVDFTYDISILQPTGAYDASLSTILGEAIDGEVVYEQKGITSTSYKMDKRAFDAQIDTASMFLLRVRAVADEAYCQKHNIRLENDGYSAPALVGFKAASGDDAEIIGLGGLNLTDSLYNFVNPEIVLPRFLPDEGARKEFINSDIAVKWNRPTFEGGAGAQPDTIKFVYDVELFAAKDYISREEMLKSIPIYVNKALKAQSDTIRWDKLDGKVEKGDYLLLRVKPTAVNDKSVAFLNDSINIVDFAMSEVFTSRYFQCANQVEISNEKPTTAGVADLKGNSIRIGEYELVLDGQLEAIEDKPGHFKGDGHVIWEPLMLTWKLAVTFDDIAINTENQVFEGVVQTWGGAHNKMPSAEVVEKLFSDWGIDNLIGDSGIPYADKLQGKANDKVKSLAEQLPIDRYYQEYLDGKARVAGLLDGNVENVTFPLEIPESINPTPVNLTISKMKFAPTYATMDLFGTFVVPETKATQGQILVFGSPRMCISPKTLIPEGGTVALLKDFEVVDPKTDFKCKFLAPKDVIEPEDGCFVSWSQNKFEWLNIDMDMTMPSDLKKVVAGKRTEESPKLHLSTRIQEWEHFIAEGSLDSFEHVDLPGYVFTGETAVVDLAANSNHKDMASFPAGYKLENSGLSKGSENEWTGLYFKELSMAFPSSIKVGNGKEPMKVAVKDLFIDKSGLTLDCGIVNAINYRAGDNATIGGFKFSLDEIMVSIVQNDFKKFGFNGKLEIPLFKGEIDYACNIYNQTFTNKGGGKGFAYVFTTSQIEDLNFDFMLGELTLDKDLTYLLVEAIDDEKGETNTNVELLVGGSVEIAGAKTANKKLANLPFELKLPGIRFCKMRIANNDGFESVYEHDRQVRAAEATEKMLSEVENSNAIGAGWWNEASKIDFGKDSDFYLNFGQWGCASPQKKIGPFEFALKKWDFALHRDGSKPYIGITLGGDITFCSDLKISAGTAIEIQSWVNNLTDFSNISLDYKGVEFREATFETETPLFSFKGTLTCADDPAKDKGYAGQIKAAVKGGLFKVDINGGYYDHKESGNNFSWGFFDIMAGGKCGIPMGPISMNNIHGGLYFNCAYNIQDKLHPKPKKGVIGIIAGMGIGTVDQVTLKGDLDLTVVYDRKAKNLSTFIFKGGVKGVGGMIDSKVNMVYEDNPQEQYFQLDITVDASLDGGINDILKELNSELEQVSEELSDYAGSFASAVGDKNEHKTGNYNESMAKYEEGKAKDKDKTDDGIQVKGPGVSVSLDFRIGHKKQGPDTKTKWHIYLGEPEWDKRCTFTLVDFKSKIVTVSVGANAYLCLGNELPNNGQLPEIPAKVRKFLNGSSSGAYANDDISKANAAREKAKKQFGLMGETNGGVMLGAAVWGYVDVDLGLFYGDMGATAGFDISVRHLSENSRCINLKGGRPGHNGWYGEGQLYAYLYAKFGFRVYLGFIKKKIDLVDAGIGGVLQAGLPNPNYFTGKVRAKLRLLNGLVNINKTFSFECGDVCEMFYGNALDDYQLFEECNIGSVDLDKAAENPLDWEIQSRPVVTTQADLNRPIAVADPTELEKIRKSSQGDNHDEGTLNRFASRKFKFEIIPDSVPELTEYKSLTDARNDRSGIRSEVEYLMNGNKVTLNLTVLNPNRFYRLRMKGRAMEFVQGKWRHPEVYDTIDNQWKFQPWSQTKDFYFVTNNKTRTLEDAEDLQPHVALAFPNNWENYKESSIQGGNTLIYALPVDLKHPTISLRRKMKGKAYVKGNLNWYVYQNGRVVSSAPNKWIENDSVSIMTPSGGLAPFRGEGRMILRYEWVEQKMSEATWKEVKNYTVYGESREKVLARERENLKNSLQSGGSVRSSGTSGAPSFTPGGTTQNTSGRTTRTNTSNTPTTSKTPTTRISADPLSSYRVEVAQVDYFGIGSETKSRFRVTVFKKEKGMVDVHRSKDLLSMRVVSSGDRKADDVFDVPLFYLKPFLGLRLDDMTMTALPQGQLYDSYLIGNFRSTASKFASRTVNGYKQFLVASDPFYYISYLSNMFFIGGPKFVSAPSNLDFRVQTPESMYMVTPFGIWNSGLLSIEPRDHLIQPGSVSIREAVMMDRRRIYRTLGTLWPLYRDGTVLANDMLGENTSGLIEGMPLKEKSYAELFSDLYQACGMVSDAIPKTTNYQVNYTKAEMKNWMAVMCGKILTYTGDYDHISLQLPAYQYGMIYNAASLGKLNPNKTFEINDNYRHTRIMCHPKVNKSGWQSPLGRRLYYSSVSSTGYVTDKDYTATWEQCFFNPEKTAEYNDMKFRFTRYRVNAWNFRRLQWTVFNDGKTAELIEPCSFFQLTYQKKYSELIKTLQSTSNTSYGGTRNHRGTSNSSYRHATKNKK